MRSRAQDTRREEKNGSRLDSGGVARKQEAGNATQMEKGAAGREEERQQKEGEGAGQRPTKKDGEQDGDAEKT